MYCATAGYEPEVQLSCYVAIYRSLSVERQHELKRLVVELYSITHRVAKKSNPLSRIIIKSY